MGCRCRYTAYFDTIPHEKLMEKVERRISDGRINKLLKMWLEQEIMEECKSWVPTVGSPQGALCEASHNPPYAKEVIMQSNLLNTSRN